MMAAAAFLHSLTHTQAHARSRSMAEAPSSPRSEADATVAASATAASDGAEDPVVAAATAAAKAATSGARVGVSRRSSLGKLVHRLSLSNLHDSSKQHHPSGLRQDTEQQRLVQEQLKRIKAERRASTSSSSPSEHASTTSTTTTTPPAASGTSASSSPPVPHIGGLGTVAVSSVSSTPTSPRSSSPLARSSSSNSPTGGGSPSGRRKSRSLLHRTISTLRHSTSTGSLFSSDSSSSSSSSSSHSNGRSDASKSEGREPEAEDTKFHLRFLAAMAYAKESVIDSEAQRGWEAELQRYRIQAAESRSLHQRALTTKSTWSSVVLTDSPDDEATPSSPRGDVLLSPRSRKRTTVTLGSRARNIDTIRRQVRREGATTRMGTNPH